MKRIISIYLILFFFIASIISNKNNLRKNIEEKYQKLEAIHLSTFISNKNIYIVDTREEISNVPTDCEVGSSCIVLEDSSVWILNTQHQWKEI